MKQMKILLRKIIGHCSLSFEELCVCVEGRRGGEGIVGQVWSNLGRPGQAQGRCGRVLRWTGIERDTWNNASMIY